MAQDPAGFRPKAFPPPEFPPRRLPIFARMPPAVFPAVLGLLGVAVALRRMLEALALPPGPGDMAMGLAAGLWTFCAVAYAIKLSRRPGVVTEELRSLPGRAGLAAATIGGLLASAILATYSARLGEAMLILALGLHSLLAALVIRALLSAPPEGREITPVWHLSFVGFIVGALAAVRLGWTGLAEGILWVTLVVAVGIWTVSLVQLFRRIPPAPLRPLLAIHLASAALFASVAGLLGHDMLAQAMIALGAAILIALILSARWIIASGFSALWGAFAFPFAAFGSALLINGWTAAGALITFLALGANLWIAWKVISMWPKGTLAARTNAATA